MSAPRNEPQGTWKSHQHIQVARLTGDGIYQVVALTCESPLDGHMTIRTSNGGVSAPVNGAGKYVWCGVGKTVEVGVYKNLTQVLIFLKSHQRPVTKGWANCSAVLKNMPV